jgi:hypothetical protein
MRIAILARCSPIRDPRGLPATGKWHEGGALIKPDDKGLLAASHEVDGRALSLNLLGRFLTRANPGDIHRCDLVRFEEADRKDQVGATSRIRAAFENLFAKGGGEFRGEQLPIPAALNTSSAGAATRCKDGTS